LILGILKERNEDRESTGEKRTILPGAIDMNTFGKVLLITSSRRVKVRMLG
jgi:hypothetical protein